MRCRPGRPGWLGGSEGSAVSGPQQCQDRSSIRTAGASGPQQHQDRRRFGGCGGFSTTGTMEVNVAGSTRQGPELTLIARSLTRPGADRGSTSIQTGSPAVEPTTTGHRRPTTPQPASASVGHDTPAQGASTLPGRRPRRRATSRCAPHHVTRPRASTTMCDDILDSPSTRSTNRMGISVIRPPPSWTR